MRFISWKKANRHSCCERWLTSLAKLVQEPIIYVRQQLMKYGRVRTDSRCECYLGAPSHNAGTQLTCNVQECLRVPPDCLPVEYAALLRELFLAYRLLEDHGQLKVPCKKNENKKTKK